MHAAAASTRHRSAHHTATQAARFVAANDRRLPSWIGSFSATWSGQRLRIWSHNAWMLCILSPKADLASNRPNLNACVRGRRRQASEAFSYTGITRREQQAKQLGADTLRREKGRTYHTARVDRWLYTLGSPCRVAPGSSPFGISRFQKIHAATEPIRSLFVTGLYRRTLTLDAPSGLPATPSPEDVCEPHSCEGGVHCVSLHVCLLRIQALKQK